MAALGELDYGHGKHARDFIFITLGTGVGGGVGLDGRLCTGPLGAAEAIGLIKVGNAPHLLALANNDLNLVSPRLMAQCNRDAILLVIERAARYLGIGVANLVTTLHPLLIVLGGGLAEMGDKLFAPVRAKVQRRVRMFPI